MPRLHSRLLSSFLPGATKIMLHLLSTRPAHVQYRHHLLKSSLQVRADVHEDDDSLLMAYVLLFALGNQFVSACNASGEPAQTPQLALLAASSRPHSRCDQLLYRLPVLRLLCADKTCSAQWTICAISLYLQALHR